MSGLDELCSAEGPGPSGDKEASRLVSIRQAADLLGSTPSAIYRSMRVNPSAWPDPVDHRQIDGASRPSALYVLEAMRAAVAANIGPRRLGGPTEGEMWVLRDLALTDVEVAERLPGRSARWIGKHRRASGLTGRPHKPGSGRRRSPRTTAVAVAAAGGESVDSIADRFGISRSAVRGIVSRSARYLVTRAEAAEALGYSPRSLASMMSRHPERWPPPIGHRLRADGRGQVPIYDLDELRAMHGVQQYKGGPRAISAKSSTVSDADGLIVCLYCEKRFRSLGRHLQSVHGVTSAEYKAEHRLPATAALAADSVRLGLQRRQRQVLETDPTALDHLQPYNTPEYLAELGQRGIEPNHATRENPVVREHRLPAQHYAVQQMLAARMAKLAAAVQAAGYPDMEAAIAATRDLSAAAAARRLGVGTSTVRRWRQRSPETTKPPPPP